MSNERQSLADQAVTALAMVKAMGESRMGLEHPERHAIRYMKRTAEQILETAFRQAIDLAYQSAELPKLVEEVRAESTPKSEQPNPT